MKQQFILDRHVHLAVKDLERSLEVDVCVCACVCAFKGENHTVPDTVYIRNYTFFFSTGLTSLLV